MLGPWGKAWRAVWMLLLLSLPGWPAAGAERPSAAWLPPLRLISGESPLEAQIMGDRPAPGPQAFRPDSALSPLLPGISLQEREGGAVLKLSQNFEMSISFLYSGEGTPAAPRERPGESPLLFKSSLDYSLLPNLQVGLSGFLYHGAVDTRYFQRRYGDVILGLGPGIRYDLGRWSLTLQSQYGTGSRNQKEGLQNWFRVWYAF